MVSFLLGMLCGVSICFLLYLFVFRKSKDDYDELWECEEDDETLVLPNNVPPCDIGIHKSIAEANEKAREVAAIEDLKPLPPRPLDTNVDGATARNVTEAYKAARKAFK